jgi:hypothetical protein
MLMLPNVVRARKIQSVVAVLSREELHFGSRWQWNIIIFHTSSLNGPCFIPEDTPSATSIKKFYRLAGAIGRGSTGAAGKLSRILAFELWMFHDFPPR